MTKKPWLIFSREQYQRKGKNHFEHEENQQLVWPHTCRVGCKLRVAESKSKALLLVCGFVGCCIIITLVGPDWFDPPEEEETKGGRDDITPMPPPL